MTTNFYKKSLVILSIFFLMFTATASSQITDRYGIYFTADDIKEKKINYGFNFSESKDLTLKDDKVILRDRSHKKEFKLTEIWGIRNDGKDYRIHNNQYYRIVYRGPIVIYSTIKKSSKYDQNFEYEEKFFSKDLNTKIFKLNIDNVKEVYKDNKVILNKLKNLPANYSISKWYEECDCYIITKWFE